MAHTGRGRTGVLFLNWRDTAHPEGGGSEVYVEQVAARLARDGVAVTIVCARYRGAARRERRPDGVQLVRVGGRLSLYPAAALAYLFGLLGRPQVVVEVQNGMPFLARLWARGAQVVVLVHHVHREQWHVVLPSPLARIGWWLESRVAPRVDRGLPYVTVSESSRRELAELGVDPARITIVPNGTPPASGVRAGRAERPTLIVVSRLVPHKRVELAVDALAQLVGEFPDLALVVVGRGWWEEHIRSHVAARGMDDHVRFTGYVDEATKTALYQQAWVLLVPSLKEGWGLSVVEAGTNRTPAVGMRGTGGTAESIRDGYTGLLADDADDLAAATGRLLRDPELRARLGRQAACYAAGFTWEETARRFRAVLADAGLSAGPGVGAHNGQAGSGPSAVVDDGALHLLGGRLGGRVDTGTGERGQHGGRDGGQGETHAVPPEEIGQFDEIAGSTSRN
ncbi:MAG TPA: glycosyltransferase family 4 protein [Jatrophihabitans sp.]|nr:glycosyltransferase family 4 protein [Jatrophihabitans sp.]